MNVVRMQEFRNRELVGVLRELLQLAERGSVSGMAFVVKVGRAAHRAGLTGDYSRNQDEALSAVVRLKERLLHQDQEDEEGSGT